jgi:hypothetical protein
MSNPIIKNIRESFLNTLPLLEDEDQSIEVCYMLEGLLKYLEHDQGLSKVIDLHLDATESFSDDRYHEWYFNLSEEEQKKEDPLLYAEVREWDCSIESEEIH